MIIEVGGGAGGLREYLESGRKKGRELHRDRLDQRIPLSGDLEVFELATTNHDGDGHRYDHITLSFSENHVSDEMLQRTVTEFRDHALAAWPEAERHRVAFYAEAHRPKILSYANSETGELVDRLVHIHVGIGKRDLLTGKSINPLGYLGLGSDNLKYLDAFQESFNARHGFSSPKDNPKITPENAVDVLARYTGSKPDVLGNFADQKADIEVILQKEILAKNVTTWEDFGQLLAKHGEVSKLYKGKFNECYRLKPTGASRAIRLKGVFFARQFIERPTSEKLSIYQGKARVAYLEQMQPRKEPLYLVNTLNEWKTVAAREIRHIHKSSPFYKNVYKPADAETRQQILNDLNDLERKNNAIASVVPAHRRDKNATARGRLPGLHVRDLDGIQARSEMLLRGNARVYVPNGAAGERYSVGVRQADDGRRWEHDAASHSGNRTQGTAGPAGQFGTGQSASASETSESRHLHVNQSSRSSVIARIESDLRDRYEQSKDKERYTEIRKNLDCTQLMNRLSHSHGLNPDLYQVATARDGTPRIQCGSRVLSPSDFLMHELGLPWKEAAPILRQVYEIQIGGKVTKPHTGRAAPAQLWKDFKAEQQAAQPALSQRLKAFDDAAKARSSVLAAKLKDEQKAALSGLFGAERKAVQSREKLRAATFKAEFNSLVKEERQVLRESIQPVQTLAWRLYLQTRAQAGNEEALAALRRLDDTARAVQPITPGITGTLIIEDEEEKRRIRARSAARSASVATILKALAQFQTVDANGNTTYRLHGKAVLRDEGHHLAVLDEHNEEAIAAGLLIAREKFGSLTLTGPEDFQRRAVAVAVDQGIVVKFKDDQLEALRLQLTEEKRRPAPKQNHSLAPASSNEFHQQSQAAAAPVTVLPAAEQIQTQVVAVTPLLSLSSADWIAAQHKPVALAYSSGDGKAVFTVVHVADYVVIDHGKTVAKYKLPLGDDFRAGQKIVIQKNGSIALPNERSGHEAGKGR